MMSFINASSQMIITSDLFIPKKLRLVFHTHTKQKKTKLALSEFIKFKML